jgi:hypothetical protein
MAGAVPADHVLLLCGLDQILSYGNMPAAAGVCFALIWHAFRAALLQDVDDRHKAGHDET